jgi:hypothetical protein
MGGMSVLSMNVLTYGKKRRLLHEPRIEVFDIPSRQSKIIGNMPTARRFGSAQYHENKIFFMGGSRKSSITSTVDIYDVAKAAKVAKDEWKFVSQMPAVKNTKTMQ